MPKNPGHTGPDLVEVVPGGSLTRSEVGELRTPLTHGIYPSPAAMQQLWSGFRQERATTAFDGQPVADVGYVVAWRTPRQLVCASPRCAKPLGFYVAYHALDEYGVVEDTSRSYSHAPARSTDPGARRPRPKPRFSLEGAGGRSASETRAVFRCAGCKKSHTRNLARLAEQMFEGAANAPMII